MIDDFREILNHYNIEFREKVGAKDIDVLCPFHDDLNFGSAKYNELKDAFHCFSCGEGGNMFQFVSKLEDCSLQEAEALISSDFKEGKKTYSVNIIIGNIERKKKRMLTNNDNMKVLDITCARMLLSIATKHPEYTFLKEWLPVITYLRGPTAQATLEEKNILNIYSIFTTQIGNSV